MHALLRGKALICWMGIVLCIIAMSPARVQAEDPATTHFYFVQISDTHFGHRNHLDLTAKIVAGINQLPIKIQCVVHTGDITADKIEDKKVVNTGLRILQRLDMPIHFVPGNHDIDAGKLASTHQAYVERFGGLITRAEYEGVVFLFVYTEPLRKRFTVDGYQPLQQLESLLQESEGKPVIIFHHAPCVDNFYNNIFHRSWRKDIRAKWVRLINAYQVKAVIAGHFHRDEFHWLGEVPLYISSSVAGYWGRQATYRIYEYRNGKIGYRSQYLE